MNIELTQSWFPNDNSKIELYDVLERQLGSFKAADKAFSIDVSALLAGSNYLLFKDGEESVVKRFLKID